MEIQHIIDALQAAGFKVEKSGAQHFNVISISTGAVVARTATDMELRTYLRGIEYVAGTQSLNIFQRFSYTRPVHGIYKG